MNGLNSQIDLEMWMYHLAEQHAIHPGAKDPQFNPTYRNFLTDGANVLPASLSHIQALLAESKTSEVVDRAQDKQAKVSLSTILR